MTLTRSDKKTIAADKKKIQRFMKMHSDMWAYQVLFTKYSFLRAEFEGCLIDDGPQVRSFFASGSLPRDRMS